MADKARKLTDKELNKLENEIYELYATTQNELSEKWREYLNSHKGIIDKTYNELQEAKKLGDKDAIVAAQEKYERTVKNVTLNDARYKAMINETTAKMANVNQIALNYVNDDMPKIYTFNYNAFADEKIDGYTFALVNENAVAKLAKSNEIELPKKKVNIPKDEQWNAKNINSQLIQGILQGESIDKIAKRMRNVTDMNRDSSIRNARTMVTGAENKGRQDSFEKAQDDGVIMTREWVATSDERTRAWHADLDGVEVGVDEPWENEYGELMYPGDPNSDPANVYNCRCSIRAHVKGFKWNEEESEERVEEEFKENIVAGVDINTPQYDVFSEEFRDVIPQLADDIENSKIPSAKELNALYRNAKTPQDEELVEFVGNLASNVLSYKNESEEMQKYHAEIFSVLSKPHDGALFRGESGEWVKHYGDFTIGKEISFEHLSFTTPNIDGTPSHHTGVIFEFESGTKSINFVGQDNVENDELILGNFIITKIGDRDGVPFISLRGK